MRKLGLRGVYPKRWKTTTITDTTDTYPVDVVQRKWDVGTLNQIWVGDISYLRTWEGWLHVATVIDAHSRRVIGWAIDEHMRADLIEDAPRMAITLRGERPAKVILDTDRGAPQTRSPRSPTSADSRARWVTPGCWDNAMAESFFATLNTEFYYRRVWPTKRGARLAVGNWIEDRYNRRH